MSDDSYIELDLGEGDLTFDNMENCNDTDISRQNLTHEPNEINKKILYNACCNKNKSL
jgi:hypothetical protein